MHLIRPTVASEAGKIVKTKSLCGVEGEFWTKLDADDGRKTQCRTCWSKV